MCKSYTPWEVLVLCFTFSFVLACFSFLPHSIETSISWLFVSFLGLIYALAHREERLETETAWLRNDKTYKGLAVALVLFAVWGTISLIVAIVEADGLDESSHWMTFISNMMGLKWGFLAFRVVKRIQLADSDTNRRALLSPIGEIA